MLAGTGRVIVDDEPYEVKQGDTNVTVVAKVNGQTATATSLGQTPQLGQRQPGQGGRRNGGYPPRPTS